MFPPSQITPPRVNQVSSYTSVCWEILHVLSHMEASGLLIMLWEICEGL
jgi:hypothetical protein